jgi:hypothetical protein
MKTLYLITTFITLIGGTWIANPNLKSKVEEVIPQQTCCTRHSSNGGLGEDYEIVAVTSCVMYESGSEKIGPANKRACDKAQKRATFLAAQ